MIESSDVQSNPAILPSYTLQLNETLKEHGAQFLITSFIANREDPKNFSLYRAQGVFDDGTKWGFPFSNFPTSETN